MAETNYTTRARAVVRALVPLVAQRAKDEAAISQKLKERLAAAEREFQAGTSEISTKATNLRHEATRQHAAAAAAAQEKRAKEIGAAQTAMDAEVRSFREKTERYEVKAKQELDESLWLAETLVESGAVKAKGEFERATKDLKDKAAELDAIRTQAGALLKSHKHEGLPVGALSEGAGAPARERLTGGLTGARGALAVLRARVRPAATRPSTIIIVAFLAAVGGAFGGPQVLQRTDATAIGGGAGAAAVGALVLMLVLRLVLRTRVPAAAKALADSLSGAFEAMEACRKVAEEARDQTMAEATARRDKEAAGGRERFAKMQDHIDDRTRVREPALRQTHTDGIDRLIRRHDEKQAELESSHAARLAEIERDETGAGDQARTRRDAAVADAKSQHAAALTDLKLRWTTGLADARAELARLAEIGALLAPSWDTLATPPIPPRPAVPDTAQFGTLKLDLAAMEGGLPSDSSLAVAGDTAFSVPAMLDFYGVGSLLVQCGPQGRAAALATLQAVMLRLLTTFPPGKVKFTIIDPVGLGQSFAGFMHLADYDESLVSDKIWTDPRHIEVKLTDLTEHMENVIQKYLRNEFATIQEYNVRAGEVAEPFRFLVIADFPANITETAAKKLASIVASGPRCGVFTLIATDARTRPPAWVPLPDIERASHTVVLKDDQPQWTDPDFGAWPLKLESPPTDEVTTAIVSEIGRQAKDAGKVQVSFDIVAPRGDEATWSLDSASEIHVPLGRAGATKLQYLTLGRGTAQHVLIAGRTGSGKSTLLHAIITNTALWYGPDQVELYLVDFKKGVEFKTYASHMLPHARVIAVESEREFGLSVLRRLDAELTRRGQMFRELGVQDLAGYRKLPGPNPTVPRTLLIVDEFQEFFVDDDKLAQESMLLMDRLVRQGRAFGMHVILGSQTIGGAYSLARSTIGQMAVRIALQCSEADSYLIMSEDNPAPRLLSRPGEAIYNDQSGMVEGNNPFQIVWLPDEKREGYLRSMGEMLKRKHIAKPPPAIVFEGNLPSRIQTNHKLAALLRREASTPPTPVLWFGEAISIKDPTNAVLRRQSGGNVLIVGQQESASLGVAISVCLSFAATAAGQSGLPRLTILDGGSAEGERTESLTRLAEVLAPTAIIRSPREADAAVGALYDELQRRRSDPGADAPPLALVVYGLQRFRTLRKSESDFSFGGEAEDGAPAVRPDQQFNTLLREGPNHGIFTIIRVDTSTNLERAMDRRMLKEFDHRVLFQMSANDSSNLIDSTAAGNLGQHRGLLYSEETGIIEKFRPYAVPADEWIDQAATHLAGGAVSPVDSTRSA